MYEYLVDTQIKLGNRRDWRLRFLNFLLTKVSNLQIYFLSQAIEACKKSLPCWIRMQNKRVFFRTVPAWFF